MNQWIDSTAWAIIERFATIMERFSDAKQEKIPHIRVTPIPNIQVLTEVGHIIQQKSMLNTNVLDAGHNGPEAQQKPPSVTDHAQVCYHGIWNHI